MIPSPISAQPDDDRDLLPAALHLHTMTMHSLSTRERHQRQRQRRRLLNTLLFSIVVIQSFIGWIVSVYALSHGMLWLYEEFFR